MSLSKEAWAEWPTGSVREFRCGEAYKASKEHVQTLSLEEAEYVVVDTETTDKNRGVARLVEIAGLIVSLPSGTVIDRFQELIYPAMSIPEEVIAIHGITDEMVRDAPRVRAVLPRFFAWCGGRQLIAHNASYDRDILRYESGRGLVRSPGLEIFCSLKLARKLLPKRDGGHSLSALTAWCGVEHRNAHRAMGDCEALAAVLMRLIAMADKGACAAAAEGIV